MIGTLIFSTIATIAMLYMRSFQSQLPVVIVLSICRAPVQPQIDAVVMAALEDKTTYGTMRLWGAVSFGIFSLVGGILTSTPTKHNANTENGSFMILFYLYGLCFLLTGFVVLWVVSENMSTQKIRNQIRMERRTSRNSKDNCIMEIITSYSPETEYDTAHTSAHAGLGTNAELIVVEATSDLKEALLSSSGSAASYGLHDKSCRKRTSSVSSAGSDDCINQVHMRAALLDVVRSNPAVLIFAVVVFLSGFGAGAIDSYLFIYLKELGGTGLLMGLARFMTCVAEVPMFQIAGPLQKKYGTWLLLVVTQFAFVVRFAYYALLVEPWSVLPCEMLNGITFAVTWNVSCTYANEISPKGCQAVMQALLEGLHFGIGYGIGSLAGGFVYQYYGAVHLFQFCGFLSLLSVVLAMCAWWHCSKHSVTDTSSTNGDGLIDSALYTSLSLSDTI